MNEDYNSIKNNETELQETEKGEDLNIISIRSDLNENSSKNNSPSSNKCVACIKWIFKKNISQKKRIVSLDVFRGITILSMLVVNGATYRGNVFTQLDHGGFGESVTFADLIQPTYLFIVGYTTGIVYGRKKPDDWDSIIQKRIPLTKKTYAVQKKTIANVKKWLKLFRRTIILFIIGVLLGLVMFIPMSIEGVLNEETESLLGGGLDYIFWEFVIFTVLGFVFYFFSFFFRRIALCFFVVAVIVNIFEWTITQVLIISLIHMLYILFMFGLPLSCADGRSGVFTDKCSAEFEVDTKLFGISRFLINGPISTLSAISSTYFGYLFYKISKYVRSLNSKGEKLDALSLFKKSKLGNIVKGVTKYFISSEKEEKVKKVQNSVEFINYKSIALWMLFSFFLLFAYWFFSYFVQSPNKLIWNTSFVFLAAALDGMILSLLYFILDVLQYRKWSHVFKWFGINPLFMWVFGNGAFAVFSLAGASEAIAELFLNSWFVNKIF